MIYNTTMRTMIQNLYKLNALTIKQRNSQLNKNDKSQTFLKLYSLLFNLKYLLIILNRNLVLVIPTTLYVLLVIVYQTEILHGLVNSDRVLDSALLATLCVLAVILGVVYSSRWPETIKYLTTSSIFIFLMYLLSLAAFIITIGLISHASYCGMTPLDALNAVLVNWRTTLGMFTGFMLGFKANDSHSWYYSGISSLLYMPALLYVEWIFWFALPVFFGSFSALHMLYSMPLDMLLLYNPELAAIEAKTVNFNSEKMLFCADKSFCTGVCGSKALTSNMNYSDSYVTSMSVASIWDQSTKIMNVSKQHTANTGEINGFTSDDFQSRLEKWRKTHSGQPVYVPAVVEILEQSRSCSKQSPGEFRVGTTTNFNAALWGSLASASFAALREQSPIMVPTLGIASGAVVAAAAAASGGKWASSAALIDLANSGSTKVKVAVIAGSALSACTIVGTAIALERPDFPSGHEIAQKMTEQLKHQETSNVRFEVRYNEKLNTLEKYRIVKRI